MDIKLTRNNILKTSVLVLLIIGLAVGVYLVQTKKIFKSKAYEDIGLTPGEIELYKAFDMVDDNGEPLSCRISREGRYTCYSKTRNFRVSLRGNMPAPTPRSTQSPTTYTGYRTDLEEGQYYSMPSYVPSPTASTSEPYPLITSTPNATPQQAEMVSADRICVVRGDTDTDCLGLSWNGPNFKKCLEPEGLQGQLFIGYRMRLPSGTEDRFFQLDPLGSDVQFAAPSIGDLNKIYLGILAWGQSYSLYMHPKIQLPADVSVIPLTLQDSRSGQTQTYNISARQINYRPSPGICK